MDGIDGAQAMIITDRAIPPQGLGASPSTIKLVLWCLRGLGAPGAALSVPRELIEHRTQLGERAVRSVVSILKDAGILEQIGQPSPSRPAQYMMHYRKLAEWLPEADREILRIDDHHTHTGAQRRRSPARDAAEHRRTAPPNKTTPARDAATAARGAGTAARDAAVLKEVTALPALPAAAAPSPELQLANLAAAAAGVMDHEAWVRVGRRAGLDVDLAAQCARTIASLGVEDARTGMMALERLGERLGKIDNPTGFLRTLLEQQGGPDPSKASSKRERLTGHNREKLLASLNSWTPEQLSGLRERTRAYLDSKLSDKIARQLMPCGQYARPLTSWPEMLDLIAARFQDIKATQIDKGAA